MFNPDNVTYPFPGAPSPQDVEEFCSAARTGDVSKLMQFLDLYGKNIVNARDNIRARAITWAAFEGRTEIVRVLLDRGADVNAGGTDDRPALSWAAQWGHAETVKVLLDRGASIHAKDVFNKTPFDAARDGRGDKAGEILSLLEQAERAEELKVLREKREAEQAVIKAAADTRASALRKFRPPKL